ncbi:MAG TPA: DUF6542 domain-containing protein [Trebonia sp.]|nr:DUF6542 domain-containing protein [Trebonia sp.]
MSALQSGGATRWIGRMSTRSAMLVVTGGALLGIIFTVLADQEPGNLLGFFIIMGAIAAVLGIQRGKVYLLFPVPALAFFVAAAVAGKVHDAKLGSSTAGTAAGLTQWIAGIFFPAVVATILVLLIGGGRWLLGRQLITGQSMLAPGGPPPRAPRPAAREPRPAPRPRRPARNDDPDRDSWADDNPFEGQSAFQTSMMPAFRDEPPADQERDQWGDPRTGPRPRQNGQPRDRGPRPSQGSGPRPQQGSGPRPSQGSGPRPQQGSGARPSFNPNQRPKRPNPPDGWNGR